MRIVSVIVEALMDFWEIHKGAIVVAMLFLLGFAAYLPRPEAQCVTQAALPSTTQTTSTATVTTTLPNRDVLSLSCYTRDAMARLIGKRRSETEFRNELLAKHLCGSIVCKAEGKPCKFVALVFVTEEKKEKK